MYRRELIQKHSLNPFAFVFETKQFPHARTLRTTLPKKIEDAFYVIAGTKKTAGIIDYFGLFLPLALRRIHEYLESKTTKEDNLNLLISSFLSLLFIPFELIKITRNIVSLLLTLISLPVILSVSYIAQKKASPLKENIKQMRFTETSYDEKNIITKTSSKPIKSLFGHGLNVDTATSEIIEQEQEKLIQIWTSPIQRNLDMSLQAKPQRKIAITTSTITNAQARFCPAFFQLNIGGAVTQMEGSEHEQELKEAFGLNNIKA